MHIEIPKADDLEQQVYTITNKTDFEQLAMAVFQYQYRNNTIYQSYCNLLKIQVETVIHPSQIPFLPISFFKTHNVTSSVNSITGLHFESSGTTGSQASRHVVPDKQLYERSFRTGFEQFYGPVQEYCILGLLPSYLERQHSSLVYTVNDLVLRSNHAQSGFYLYDFEKLANTIASLERIGQKTILFGVTYALLDFAVAYPMPFKHTTLIETGGMKGRKKELLRAEVHELLKKAFHLEQVHSEYGMTELLSQAYAIKDGKFHMPPWMRVLIREEDDPFTITNTAKTGCVNIIDLANLYSCAFIATDDIGRINKDGSFEILGRMDTAEIRGCSLLAL